MMTLINGAPSSSNLAICGNGIKEYSEACDDGNTISGDGCSSDCQLIEEGYDCSTEWILCISKKKSNDKLIKTGIIVGATVGCIIVLSAIIIVILKLKVSIRETKTVEITAKQLAMFQTL